MYICMTVSRMILMLGMGPITALAHCAGKRKTENRDTKTWIGMKLHGFSLGSGQAW